VTEQADHNFTAEEDHTVPQPNIDMITLSIVLVISVGSFIAGFLLEENGAGGMRYDFYYHSWPIIQRFSTTSTYAAITNYHSTENPLLYITASLLPLHSDPKLYHTITFIVGLLIWPLLSWAYYRRYSKYGIDWLWSSFGAGAILLSPTFRSSTFWGNTDWLPFAFCAGTSLLLSAFQDIESTKARAIGTSTLVALAVVSAFAFYTRQYYAFLPIFAAWVVLTRTKTPPLLVLSIFFAAMLPELFLIYVWKGIVPPDYHGVHLHPAPIDIWKTGAVIGFLSLPIIIGCIQQSLCDVLPSWWGLRSTVIAVIGLLVFVIALWATEWPDRGGGIIVKAGLEMGGLGNPFILTVSYFGLLGAILFSMSSTTNTVLAGAYLLPLFLTRPTYQRYLEPSLIVTLFLFADVRTARTIFNKRVLVCNFVFTGLILAVGIIYYNLFGYGSDFPLPTTE
jgi:hypothetical protein